MAHVLGLKEPGLVVTYHRINPRYGPRCGICKKRPALNGLLLRDNRIIGTSTTFGSNEICDDLECSVQAIDNLEKLARRRTRGKDSKNGKAKRMSRR